MGIALPEGCLKRISWKHQKRIGSHRPTGKRKPKPYALPLPTRMLTIGKDGRVPASRCRSGSPRAPRWAHRGGRIRRHGHCGQQSGNIRLNTESPYNPASPLLDRYPREMKTFCPHKNICVIVHSSPVFTRAEERKHLNIHSLPNGRTKHHLPT